MFEQAVLSNGPASKRVWTTFAGVTGQALLVTFAVMIPMIWPEAMPSHQTLLKLFIPTVPAGPPPKSTASAAPVAHATPKPFNPKAVTMPVAIPDRVLMTVDEAPAIATGPTVPGGISDGREGGVPGGSLLNGILGAGAGTGVAPTKPVEHVAPAAAVEPVKVQRVPQGGRVDIGVPVYRVEPKYPPIAITARISGVVVLEGVVGTDGRIRELKVKSGHPMLAPAAVDAVRQWLYRPTTLNGVPVEVVAPITVTFRLN